MAINIYINFNGNCREAVEFYAQVFGTKAPKIMTYQELVDYPVDCKFKETQVAELKKLQAIKNFDPDPDLLNAEDYDFNGRLKATIWWYTYRCDQS